jgi:hypothetical protein
MDETRDRFGWPRELDPLDPLARFPSESETGTSSSSSAATTVSVIADLPPEWQSLALEPRTAAAEHPTFVRAEAHVRAASESAVSSTRSGTSRWAMVRTLPLSVWWIICLAVLVPSLATLVLRTQLLSTAAPLDAVQDDAAVGTVRPVEDQKDAQLATQPPLVTAPHDTNDEFVLSTQKEPTPSPGARQSALTSPSQQTTALVAQPPPRLSRPDGGAVQTTPAAQSDHPVGVDVILADDKATRWVTPVPGPKTSSDRLTFRGAISVESQPAGAQVAVDGRPVGVTPLAGWALAAGSHVVRIDLDGYERWSAAIQVVADKTVNVVTNLQPTRHH